MYSSLFGSKLSATLTGIVCIRNKSTVFFDRRYFRSSQEFFRALGTRRSLCLVRHQQQRNSIRTEGRMDHCIAGDSPTVLSVTLASPGCTELKWSDDHSTTFPSGWLRDNCHCSDCLHPETLQRCFDPEVLNNSNSMTVTQLANGSVEGSLVFDTADDFIHLYMKSTNDEGHLVRLPTDWLRSQDFACPTPIAQVTAIDARDVSDTVVDGRRLHWDPSTLGKYSEQLNKQRIFGVLPSAPPPASLQHVPHLAYNDLRKKDADQTTWLRSIMHTFGIVFISGVPYDSNTVPNRTNGHGRRMTQWEVSVDDIVRAHFGYPRETIWGTIWDTTGDVDNDDYDVDAGLESKEHATKRTDAGNDSVEESIPDTAYSTDALDPHTDCTYLRDPPELQVFLCTQQADIGCGGESCFIDGFRAANELLRQAPHVYDFFCNTPLAFKCVHNGVDVQTIAPILQRRHGRSLLATDKVAVLSTDLLSVRYNSYDRGPMSHLDSATIAAFYEYFPTLVRVMRTPELMLHVRLGEGDMVIVDNHRVMHGRNSFHGTVERRLVGCYAEMTEIDTSLLHA
eukprot:m.958556 g.958556  ORF g.958556 m.958556 type:complete len:565 (+) comp23881_c0_seq2:373-2067(+)